MPGQVDRDRLRPHDHVNHLVTHDHTQQCFGRSCGPNNVIVGYADAISPFRAGAARIRVMMVLAPSDG